jgi:hypothetical protein
MSKVKIQGNASGTGVFTIEAPGTNDPRTLTLPNSTGTLLDENSSLPAANLTGDIAGARLPDPLPAISGASLTNLPSHSGNVAFPATQVASADANTLDDYEEGNWTPTWAPSGGSWSGTGVGKYTKIGRQVTASFNWIASAQATGSKFNAVGGLPFTSLNETTRYPATVSLNYAGSADSILMPTMSANSTSINLQMQSQSTGGHGEFTPSMTTSSTEISLTITYMTA